MIAGTTAGRDVLAGSRPDAAAGRQFLRALAAAFTAAGLDRDWTMFMVSSQGGPSLIWLHLQDPPWPGWQDGAAERRMLAAARSAFR